MTHPIAGTGSACFQLPSLLVEASTRMPLDGPAWRVLCFLLWEAHRMERWPGQAEEPAEVQVRYPAADILKGAGLASGKDYRPLHAALAAIEAAWFVVEQDGKRKWLPIIADPDRLSDNTVALTLTSHLAWAHWRPLDQYALLNITQINKLSKPLDVALYIRACAVVRRQHPFFELTLDQIAGIGGLPGDPDWSDLRRSLLGACSRVAALTGARFRLQAYRSGGRPGSDRIRVQVQGKIDVTVEAKAGKFGSTAGRRWKPFRVEHKALFYEVDGEGHRMLKLMNRSIMDVFN
jgi:hypothetical protein